MTPARLEARAKGGRTRWANLVDRLGEQGAQAYTRATVFSKSQGGLTRKQEAERAWVELEAARRRGRGRNSQRTLPLAGAVMPEPTKRVLDFVAAHWQRHGFSPSIREIADECGHTSNSITRAHLIKLEDCGAIAHARGVARSFVLLRAKR